MVVAQKVKEAEITEQDSLLLVSKLNEFFPPILTELGKVLNLMPEEADGEPFGGGNFAFSLNNVHELDSLCLNFDPICDIEDIIPPASGSNDPSSQFVLPNLADNHLLYASHDPLQIFLPKQSGDPPLADLNEYSDSLLLSMNGQKSAASEKVDFKIPLEQLPIFDLSEDVILLTDIAASPKNEDNISRTAVGALLLNHKFQTLAAMGFKMPDTILTSSYVELSGSRYTIPWGRAHVQDNQQLKFGNDSILNYKILTKGWAKKSGDQNMANELIRDTHHMRPTPHVFHTGCVWLAHYIARLMNYSRDLKDVPLVTWAIQPDGTFEKKEYLKGGGARVSFEVPGGKFWLNKDQQDHDNSYGGKVGDLLPDGSRRDKKFCHLARAIAKLAKPLVPFVKLGKP